MHQHRIITSAPRPSPKGAAILAWLTAIARQHAHVATLVFDQFVNGLERVCPQRSFPKGMPQFYYSIQAR